MNETYKYLKENTKFEGYGLGGDAFKMSRAFKTIKNEIQDRTCDIRWNFTKFLIDRNGDVVARFEPSEPLEIVRGEINRLLDGEELSIKKKFSRKGKDIKSVASKKMVTQRVRTATFFFILTYTVTFIFDTTFF